MSIASSIKKVKEEPHYTFLLLIPQPSWVTKTEFLLTIPRKYQEVGKQLSDEGLILDSIENSPNSHHMNCIANNNKGNYL